MKNIGRLRSFKQYETSRDRLDCPTTQLSAALNFGCTSAREAYWAIRDALGSGSTLLKQLYWRDFFYQLTVYEPRSLSFKSHMDPAFDANIRWRDPCHCPVARGEYQCLWNSKTGFLLVDAAMAEMRHTGFMHNRARMIVAFFWTKYLRIHVLHPKYGSQVGFSSLLVDAVGPSQNKMNHQWVTELDYAGRRYAPKGVPLAGRPMDISNAMIRKWDPEGKYIHQWLPHLKHVPVKELARWDGTYSNLHPAPIFDPRERYKEWVSAVVGGTS